MADIQVPRGELVACLALATDLGMGQPLEQGLRTCLLAVGVGRRIGLSREDLAGTYYVTLLRFVGCNSHSHTDAHQTGDERAFRAGIAPVLNASPSQLLKFTLSRVGRGSPPAARIQMVAAALAQGSKGARDSIAETCEAAQMIARRLGFGDRVVDALGYTYEHYDGSGYPAGAAGDQIPVAAHVAMLARDFEILHRMGGHELLEESTRRRRGKAYAAGLLDGFAEHAVDVLDRLPSDQLWEAAVEADPDGTLLTGRGLDDALDCLADFSDMRTPYLYGYSKRVASLASAAAGSKETGKRLSAAGRIQELGMTAVSSVVLDKPGPLSEGEWERVRLHPYFTERILARCPALSGAGALAGAHHERIDGTGYHRGLPGDLVSAESRILAAAGAYVAITSDRPWRPAQTGDRAVAALREGAAVGAWDPEAVETVLAAAGEQVARPVRRKGLTDREVEVLRLITQGLSNRQVAERLVISVKTVGRHVENIYAKLGVRTRAGATICALQLGLLSSPHEPVA